MAHWRATLTVTLDDGGPRLIEVHEDHDRLNKKKDVPDCLVRHPINSCGTRLHRVNA